MEFAKVLQVPFYLFTGSGACIKSREYLPQVEHILLQVGMENHGRSWKIPILFSLKVEGYCRVFVPVSTKEHNIV